MKKSFQFLLSIYILLNPISIYAQYCFADTSYLSGEWGGITLVENTIIKCENVTFSTDGGLIGQDAIIFKPNFHVKAGVNFSAFVTDCRGNKPYITFPAENAVLDNSCSDFNNIVIWDFEWNEVDNATEYQIKASSPFFAQPLFNQTVVTNNYTFQYNSYFTNNQLDIDWRVEVRAKVNGVWTPWYGSTGDQPLFFTIEPLNIDCPPLMTTPLPQAVLDNGCNGVAEIMNWHFEWTPVQGATEYQLIIEHPSVGVTTFDKTLTTNSWTFSQPSQINTYFTGWTAKVRAKLVGQWTAWHGSTIEEEVMLFNVELVNTDCAPKITAPTPQMLLDNGCTNQSSFFEWEFKILTTNVATETETRVKRPDGSVFSNNNLQVITITDEGNDTITQIYRIFNEYIPANELSNWSVQARSKINGAWTSWFGHTLNTSETYFDVEPPNTDCSNLLPTENSATNRATSFNHQPLAKPMDFKVYPNPFHQESTIEYVVTQNTNVKLEIYTLTGQLVQVLVNNPNQAIGNYTTSFKPANGLSSGMYLVRLQVGEEVRFQKVVLLELE